MADAITYADLRFVKVPLKNSASNHLGQGKSCLLPPPPIIFHPHSTELIPDSDFGAFSFPDCEAYEDGELPYENVQVSPVPGGPPGLASPALADKAGRAGRTRDAYRECLHPGRTEQSWRKKQGYF